MPKSSKDKVVAAAAKAAAKAASKTMKKKEKKEKKKGITKKEVKKEVDKEVKKRTKDLQGPKSAYQVSVTATLGHITGNREHGPELKMSVFLHPGLVKGPDDGTEFGPLQAAAAQYGLWRCTNATIIMTPLVGPNAVSGTVNRFSVNLTQAPSSTNWGGLGARKHFDVQAGVRGSMKLSKRDLAGPRDGGWWLTDTNAEGAQSAGPLFEVHGLGETTSTYQGTPWTKELYIVELRGTWQFANYTANPALGSLDRVEEQATVSLGTTANGEIEMTVNGPANLMRLLDDPTAEKATPTSPAKPGEIIYQVVDTAAGLASTLVPPPFGWLIKGGWWFLKKVFGAGENAATKFLVYPSLADAQNNKPAISTNTGSMRSDPVQTTLQVTQLNSPNMGGPNAGTHVMSITPLPLQPQYPPPPGPVVVKMKLSKVYRLKQGSTNMFSFPPGFLTTGAKRGTTTYKAVHFQALDPVAASIDSLNVLQAYGPLTPRGRGPLKIPQNMTTADRDLEVLPLATYEHPISDQASPAIHLNAVLWVPQDHDKNFRWLNLGSVQVGYLTSGPEAAASQTWKYKTELRTLNPENNVNNATLADGPWLTVWFSRGKGGTDVDWQNGGWYPNNNVSEILGACLMGGNITQFNLSAYMAIPSQKLSRIEKLAAMIGISPDAILSDEESDSDAETATEGESSDDDDDDATSEASFDVVPPQTKSDDYLRLREQGLSHEQAMEVLALNPAV